jgi:Xaa-Pro aminopeptidase
MRRDGVSLEEIEGRIKRLQGHLKAQSIGWALLVQQADRYYFTGTAQSGFVAIPAEGEPLLFIRKDVERARLESPLPVIALASMRTLAADIAAKWGDMPAPMGLELDTVPAAQYLRFQKLFAGAEIKDASHAVMLTRAIKSPWEIEATRKAGDMVAKAVAMVPQIMYGGMREIELAAAVEFEMRKRGHGGFTMMRAFNQQLHYGHVYAGATAASAGGFDFPSIGWGMSPAVAQGASERIIKRDEPIVVDLVGNYDGYLCDQTRVFVLGSLGEPFNGAFEAAVDIQTKVAHAAKPGVKASELYSLAVEMASETPYGDHFLGEVDSVSFVGHGIGLEIDEYPFLAKGFDLELQEGMVFALEPKFTFKDKGAVGIEDTYVVTSEGGERLSSSPQQVVTI